MARRCCAGVIRTELVAGVDLFGPGSEGQAFVELPQRGGRPSLLNRARAAQAPEGLGSHILRYDFRIRIVTKAHELEACLHTCLAQNIPNVGLNRRKGDF